ncbi:response regulator transcription factor [Roseovarius sp. M141]|uniref:response regulator transcription factor n=1 Tax=Roseovarius sp. M141 TaxID=2583806 RepID=UPI0020CF2C84|nr:response regulator [Roseovarius sp. M141]MCQ0092015.1 response regulator transcription factor [Roseovarius sp. M141]
MPETEPTVYIIDDDGDIRSSLSRALTKRGFDVLAFASAKDFLDAHDSSISGCIILDYGMPEMTGLELQKKLIADGFTIPMIFITGHGGVPESVQAMKAGAIDFLEKPFRTEILVKHIRLALETAAATSESREKARQARIKLETLTSRETEIVAMIVSNPSNTTSKEIARALDISPRTVDHHRARILEKMQIKSIVELVDLAVVSKTFTS